MVIVPDLIQGTEQWMQERCGKPSASNFDKIVTTKGELSKQAEKYIYTLAIERVTGVREESFSSYAMERGIEKEKEAREFYEIMHSGEVQQVGFVYPDEDKLYGCSPDGLVGQDGMLEIKCALAPATVSYILDEKQLVKDYYQQLQGNLLVTGRKWIDIMSYYPAVRPIIVRVFRDEPFLSILKASLFVACKQIETIAEKIRG